MRLHIRLDPLVVLIVGAMLLATILPVPVSMLGGAQAIVDVAIFVLFLLYGMRLSRREVRAGLGNHRLLGPLIIWTFGVMGVAGWVLWQGSQPYLPSAIALGFLYLGVLPSTVQSATVYCSVAGGNVASSVVAAALVNILAVFISAPLFSLLSGGEEAVFDGRTLIKVLTILLLPFILGQTMQGFTREWISRNRKLIAFMDRSVIALSVYVAFSGAVGQDIWSTLDTDVWLVLLTGCGLLLLFAYSGAWLVSGWLRLERGDRISMLFAGGQKSIAMGAPLAMVLFPAVTAGTVLLPLLIYHLAQMVVAAPVATRLGRAREQTQPLG